MVGGMCKMLPYGTGICCHAFIKLKFSIASVHSLFLEKKSGIDNSTEWSTIPACPKPYMLFLTGAIPKGLILQKQKQKTKREREKKVSVCFCMHVLFCVNLCQVDLVQKM